jgi:hypothetical protein
MIKCPQCGYEFELGEKTEMLEETTEEVAKEDTEQVQKYVNIATEA